MKRIVLLISFLLPAVGQLYSQAITGRVMDASNLLPIGEATVEIRSYGQITQTGPDGFFSIDPMYLPCSLLVYSTGYNAQIYPVKVAPSSTLEFLLEPAAYELDSILIVAGESDLPLKSQAGSVSLIRAHDLQRDNNLSIAPALNRIPGVQMQQGALNTARISIRGIGARNPFGTAKIRAYFEDIPLTDGSGETSLEDLDLSLIGSAEILRGPTSSIYGAGLGGTIRLAPAKPAWNQKRVSGSYQAGSFGLQRMVGEMSVAGKKSSIQLALSDTHSDGFRDNSTYDRFAAGSVIRIVPDASNTFTWIGNLTTVKAFIPSSIDRATFDNDPSQAAFTWARTAGFESYDRAFTGLSWRHRYDEQFEHWISVFGGYRDAYEPRPFNILRENSVQTGVRARWIYRINKLRITGGSEVFRESYDWQTYENINGEGERGEILSDNEEIRIYANGFLQARGTITEALAWETGLNLNVTGYDYQDFFRPDSLNLSGTYTFAPTLSPRLALVWNAPRWTARAQLSHGFSPPTLEETLTPEGQINPDIAPETGWNLEAGWRGHILPHKLWLDATIYQMWVSDLLVARRVGNDQFVGVNAGKTLHRGLEMALFYQPFRRLKLWGNYAFQDFSFTDFVDEGNDYSGNELTGVPRHQISAGLHQFLGPIQLQFTTRYVSEIPLRDDNSVYSESYLLLNTRMDYTWTMAFASDKVGAGVWNIRAFAGINNILNSRYASMVQINAGSFGGNLPRYYYPGNPREWYAGIVLSLDKKRD